MSLCTLHYHKAVLCLEISSDPSYYLPKKILKNCPSWLHIGYFMTISISTLSINNAWYNNKPTTKSALYSPEIINSYIYRFQVIIVSYILCWCKTHNIQTRPNWSKYFQFILAIYMHWIYCHFLFKTLFRGNFFFKFPWQPSTYSTVWPQG